MIHHPVFAFFPAVMVMATVPAIQKPGQQPRDADAAETEQAFVKRILEEGPRQVRRSFLEAKQKDPKVRWFKEATLNDLGYRYLNERKQIPEAIEIFLLNIDAYPASSNAHDSLAEAYMVNGQKDLADRHYKKSLELDPRNRNAIDMLCRLHVMLPPDRPVNKSAPQSGFVTANGIRLHYLDWGGKGEVLVFLTGMSHSAHIFGDIVPHFTDRFRVLGLTRRGHGQSDSPAEGYDTATLVEDLRQFLNALEVKRTHLAGHSLAGDEMTRFAGLYPDRVGKLIYLDAANDRSSLTDRDIYARIPEVFAALFPSISDVTSYEAYRDWVKNKKYGFWSAALEADFQATSFGPDGKLRLPLSQAVSNALNKGTQEAKPDYTKVQAPALSFHAIYSLPTVFPWLPTDATQERRKAQDFLDTVLIPHQRRQVERFRQEVPNGRVIVMPDTHHYLFITRQDEVVREMKAFLSDKP
jgi:pimeloyl-ACP methyl ester carboxylesterase